MDDLPQLFRGLYRCIHPATLDKRWLEGQSLCQHLETLGLGTRPFGELLGGLVVEDLFIVRELDVLGYVQDIGDVDHLQPAEIIPSPSCPDTNRSKLSFVRRIMNGAR